MLCGVWPGKVVETCARMIRNARPARGRVLESMLFDPAVLYPATVGLPGDNHATSPWRTHSCVPCRDSELLRSAGISESTWKLAEPMWGRLAACPTSAHP